MISLEQALKIHELQIKIHGGAKGIRDQSLLEAALARPFATFDGLDLYPKPIDKAAAILESTLINHPFIDGNKRTGYVLMELILRVNGLCVILHLESQYDFTIKVAEGKMKIEEIIAWLNKHVIELSTL
ncbi:death-on-curing protein [Nonlabens dokdonensis]|jgi:death-on-curing protein|uniref:Prophage maintenance system killer protein n=2 Tax=Nonlabens dokdonensis TaxID=328515 RepID=L7WA12_NONDD|nr:type II toxin-antitoxin system death-on-curing family toxin [Nonlabens dokdonensis]AGC76964.1 prophage maintenance system killer protein [Nonlabens dokdonensis DSW-6]PZX36868.1 death-on-curing protein [Nonlabens dokdonensis]